MFISPAYAQAAGGGGGGMFVQLMPLLLIFVVFYFLLIRPQQRKVKAHREMLANLRRGDKVVTGGGIIATVTRVNNDNELTVEIAEGVRVLIARSTVSTALAKTEPADKSGKAGGGPAKGPADVVETPAEGLKGLLGGLLGGKR